MTLDWLRKVHNIHIVVEPEYHLPFEVTGYIYNIHCVKESWLEGKETYKTYEEAVEAAIKYTLENLI